MDQKRITVQHMAYQVTRPNTTRFFFSVEFVKDQVYKSPVVYVIWQTYMKEFMLLQTMSHHRCSITHGSRLNTGWTFPVPLMEAMLGFMEHKVTRRPLMVLKSCFYKRFLFVWISIGCHLNQQIFICKSKN